MTSMPGADAAQRAAALHKGAVVIDGLAGTTFAFDELLAAGLTAAHITVAAHHEGFAKTLEFIKDYYAALDTYPDKLLLVRTADDILKAKAEGKLGLILGFQTSSPIE
ncbi:MAG: membrane dipeptidase, partial [Methanocella sp.]